MGAWGRHSSGPASGLVRLELCCVLTFWFFWVKPKERSEEILPKQVSMNQIMQVVALFESDIKI